MIFDLSYLDIVSIDVSDISTDADFSSLEEFLDVPASIDSYSDISYDPLTIDESPSESSFGLTYSPEMNSNIIGDPVSNMTNWEMQQGQNSCAPTSQGFIIEQFTGLDIPEDALIDIAEANGWYDAGTGTYMEDVGNLLEVFGLQTDRVVGADFDDLREALINGDGVVVGIDANELWYGDNDFFFEGTPNHAVQVIGIDETNGMVILNDPGVPNGAGTMYPIDVFMDAWADSNFFMVTAHQ